MPIITITTPQGTPQRFEVSPNRETVLLGRSSKCDINISCASVSGSHATVRKLHDGYVLRDMGSTNGMKLEGKRVTEIHLENGQNIKLGDVIFKFELEAGASSSDAKAKTRKQEDAPPEPQPQSEHDALVLGLALMGGGLIALGCVVLVGMDSIKAIAERGQNFIIGGGALILVGLLCLCSILFVTGKIKLPKLVVQFDDEDDDDDDEDEDRKKRRKRGKRKSRKDDDEEEDENDKEESDDNEESGKDDEEDSDLGKAPKEPTDEARDKPKD